MFFIAMQLFFDSFLRDRMLKTEQVLANLMKIVVLYAVYNYV